MQVVTVVAVFSILKGLKALEGPHNPGRSRDTVEDRMLGKARPACPDVSHQALLVPSACAVLCSLPSDIPE